MVLKQDELMMNATSAHVDNIYVNEDILPADEIKNKLESFCLTSKDPMRLKDGTWGLGRALYTAIEVRESSSWTSLHWHSILHLWLVGTFSCLWVAPHSNRMMKRQASMVTNGWNNTVKDAPCKQLIVKVLTRVCQDDPVRGILCLAGEVNAWVDASSFAMGLVLESHSAILEGVYCSVRLVISNMVELDATLKGLTIMLQWRAKVVHLYTELLCMYHRLTDTLMSKAWVRIITASKMLACRRLSILQQLIEEYGLVFDVNLTTSLKNLAE